MSDAIDRLSKLASKLAASPEYADLLAEARKRHRGAARLYARASDGPGREAALVELERAAIVAVMAAAAVGGTSTAAAEEVLDSAKRGLGL